MVLEHPVSLLVDLIRQLALVLLARIHRPPLAVPHAQPALVHPLPLLLIAPPQTVLLGLVADVPLRRRGEPEHRVVVDRVRDVLPALMRVPEVREVGRERVPVEEERVVWVGRTDRGVYAVVERDNARVVWVGGLVERVIARDPRVAHIVLRELLPEPDDAVLEVLMLPELGDVGAGVRVPVGVLATRGGVKIEDGVDAVLGAQVDDTVEVLETLGFQNAWVHIVYIERSQSGASGALWAARPHPQSACS